MDEHFYRFNRWFRQLVPVTTTCFRCEQESPVIHLDHGDFAALQMDAAIKFSEVGWEFNYAIHRSYCPNCKGQGR